MKMQCGRAKQIGLERRGGNADLKGLRESLPIDRSTDILRENAQFALHMRGELHNNERIMSTRGGQRLADDAARDHRSIDRGKFEDACVACAPICRVLFVVEWKMFSILGTLKIVFPALLRLVACCTL